MPVWTNVIVAKAIYDTKYQVWEDVSLFINQTKECIWMNVTSTKYLMRQMIFFGCPCCIPYSSMECSINWIASHDKVNSIEASRGCFYFILIYWFWGSILKSMQSPLLHNSEICASFIVGYTWSWIHLNIYFEKKILLWLQTIELFVSHLWAILKWMSSNFLKSDNLMIWHLGQLQNCCFIVKKYFAKLKWNYQIFLLIYLSFVFNDVHSLWASSFPFQILSVFFQ